MIEHLLPPTWRAMRQQQMRFGGGGTPSAPPPPRDPPKKSDAEIQDAAAQMRARNRLRQGRTYLTSRQGVAGDTDVSGQSNVVQRPTLLGGGNA